MCAVTCLHSLSVNLSVYVEHGLLATSKPSKNLINNIVVATHYYLAIISDLLCTY